MDYEKASQYWMEKDKSSIKMPEDELKKEIDSFIKARNVCALATASGDFVRNTPIEYNYFFGCFYLFSEGGLKFKALKDNKHVCLAIFDPVMSFTNLNSLQVTGIAEMIEPYSEEYVKVAKEKKLSIEALKRLPSPMSLIKIVPTVFDLLKSDLKKKGYSSRQQLVLKQA